MLEDSEIQAPDFTARQSLEMAVNDMLDTIQDKIHLWQPVFEPSHRNTAIVSIVFANAHTCTTQEWILLQARRLARLHLFAHQEVWMRASAVFLTCSTKFMS